MRKLLIVILSISSIASYGQRVKQLGQPGLRYYMPSLICDTIRLNRVIIGADTDSAFTYDRSDKLIKYSKVNGGGSGGVTTMAAIGSSPNANAATISGSTLTMQPASASFGGVVTTGTQTFAGAKTFSSDLLVQAVLVGNAGYSTVTRMGNDALLINNDETGNTGVGHESLRSNLNGYFNTGYGRQSLFSVVTGNTNTAAGHKAGYGAVGSGNVFIGNSAGETQTSGDGKFWLSNSSTVNLLYGDFSTGQLSVNPGSSPSLSASAQFEINSTSRGFLMPRMTASQRTGISSPATGLQVYDTDSNRVLIYNGSAWKGLAHTDQLGGGGSGVTSINSETGANQTISSGTGIVVSTTPGSNTHSISLNSSYITSGAYTPTLTNGANITSSTAYPCQYMRVGNVVTVSGKIYIDYTTAGVPSSVGISLPIASSISNDYEVAGTANAEASNGRIQGDATNNRAEFYIGVPSSAAYDYFFIFTYQIL